MGSFINVGGDFPSPTGPDDEVKRWLRQRHHELLESIPASEVVILASDAALYSRQLLNDLLALEGPGIVVTDTDWGLPTPLLVQDRIRQVSENIPHRPGGRALFPLLKLDAASAAELDAGADLAQVLNRLASDPGLGFVEASADQVTAVTSDWTPDQLQAQARVLDALADQVWVGTRCYAGLAAHLAGRVLLITDGVSELTDFLAALPLQLTLTAPGPQTAGYSPDDFDWVVGVGGVDAIAAARRWGHGHPVNLPGLVLVPHLAAAAIAAVPQFEAHPLRLPDLYLLDPTLTRDFLSAAVAALAQGLAALSRTPHGSTAQRNVIESVRVLRDSIKSGDVESALVAARRVGRVCNRLERHDNVLRPQEILDWAKELGQAPDPDELVPRVQLRARFDAVTEALQERHPKVVMQLLSGLAQVASQNGPERAAAQMRMRLLSAFTGFAAGARLNQYLFGRSLLAYQHLGLPGLASAEIQVAMPRSDFVALSALRADLPAGIELEGRWLCSGSVGINIVVLEPFEPPVRRKWWRRPNQGTEPGDYLVEGTRFPITWFGKGQLQTLQATQLRIPNWATSVLTRLYGRKQEALSTLFTLPVLQPPSSWPERLPTATPTQSQGKGSGSCTGHPGHGADVGEQRLVAARRPFLSIIVPVFNTAEYLATCLDSLCLQDSDDYEIVVVDDGSLDGSAQLLTEYAARHPDLIRVFTKPNGGLSDARNFGIDQARGEYLAFVDSDDFVAPGFVSLPSARARATGADVVVFEITEWTQGFRRRHTRFVNSYGHPVRQRPEILVSALAYSCNKIFHHRLFDQIRFPVGQAFEDSATTFNLLWLANQVEVVAEPLYFYRFGRPGSISSEFDERFADIFKSFDSLRDFYAAQQASGLCAQELAEVMRRTAFARVWALEAGRPSAAARQFVNDVYDYLDTKAPGWQHNKYFTAQLAKPHFARQPRYLASRNRETMLAYLEKSWTVTGQATAVDLALEPELLALRQAESLQVMDLLHDFCTSHGLRYYLAEGTLLGAIRHQGFIPWDDDLDLVLPRADHDRLLEALRRGEVKGLRLFHHSTHQEYHLGFAKVLSSGPSRFRRLNLAVPQEFVGTAVDLFPLDADLGADLEVEHQIRELRDCLLYRVGYFSADQLRSRGGDPRSADRESFTSLHRKLERLMRRHNNAPDTSYLTNFASSYPPEKERFKKDWFGTGVPVTFAGRQYLAPRNWDQVLHTTYGRYLELPPPDRRKTPHQIGYLAGAGES